MNLRLRTVDGAYAALKSEDPDTQISKHFIRQAVTTGRIPCIKQGKKCLFALEDLYKYIEDERDRARQEYQQMIQENQDRIRG